jgi:hypothetical protein
MPDLPELPPIRKINPPASAPDTFVISTTPGSQTETPIPPAYYLPQTAFPASTPQTFGSNPYDITGSPTGFDGFDAAGNPVIAGNSPASAGGGASITGVTTPGFDLPDVSVSAAAATQPYLPPDAPQGGSEYGGLTPSQVTGAPAVAAANNALGQIGAFAGNWVVRGGVIVVGIVLIAAAAWSLSGEPGKQAVRLATSK